MLTILLRFGGIFFVLAFFFYGDLRNIFPGLPANGKTPLFILGILLYVSGALWGYLEKAGVLKKKQGRDPLDD